ncbi:hypothetical protein IVA79_08140 [Bradyrhizobium sp. 138]|uniref:ribbon-helix-helix protein, CopG family n=1 Tax=Bradyrhizobium sp. 138 TaxID=2782615 RepID=UPI001FF71CF9|nr:ribbon-helix-helix protein, CopG family [Bradyrhizobium sp. 138]MCK1733925.1 hypothetical protein [Bradyrhizobium sp. 138]
MSPERTIHLNILLQVRATENLTAALDRAAGQRLTSRSDYIRTAVIDRLQRDGFDLNSLPGAA